jgi:CHAT domain-containing protein
MTFSRFITEKQINENLKLSCLLLAELSATPWKFELLWSIWPQLGFKDQPHDLLRIILLDHVEDQSLFHTCAIVYDDITMFYDVIGNYERANKTDKNGYKIAYLSLRPFMFAKNIKLENIEQPTTTEESYMLRMRCVAANEATSDILLASKILVNAAMVYERRHNGNGVVLCEQNAQFLKLFTTGEFVENYEQLSYELFIAAIKSAEQNIFFEIILQWYKSFNSVFVKRLDSNRLSLQEMQDIRNMVEKISTLNPIVDFVKEDSDPNRILITLHFLRLAGRKSVPPELSSFAYGNHTLKGILVLKRRFYSAGQLPKQMLDSLFEFIEGTLAPSAKEENQATLDDMKRFMVEEQVMSVSIKKSKNELSEQEFIQEVEKIDGVRDLTPFFLEVSLLRSVDLLQTNKSLGLALLQAVRHLAQYSREAKVVEKINQVWNQVHSKSLNDFLASINKAEKEHKYVLGLGYRFNAAISKLDLGQIGEAYEIFMEGWGIILKLKDKRLPWVEDEDKKADLVIITLKYGIEIGRMFYRIHKYDNAFQIVDDSIRIAYDDLDAKNITQKKSEIAQNGVLANQLASECLEAGKLGDAKARTLIALQLADDAKLDLESCTIRVAISYFDIKVHDWSAYLNILGEARQHANSYRRSFQFEEDKINACTATQAAFIYAFDKYFEFSQGWESIAVIEGLRSRALLDLIGLNEAIVPDAALPEPIQTKLSKVLTKLRANALPGHDRNEFALRNILPDRQNWTEMITELDTLVNQIRESAPLYSNFLSGDSMTVAEIIKWAGNVSQPTIIVYWVLGDRYSCVLVLSASPGKKAEPPEMLKVSLTMAWLNEKVQSFKEQIRNGLSPDLSLYTELSEKILGPIAPYFGNKTEIIYLCPAQGMNDLPIGALLYQGQPLNIQLKVSIIPSLSVLRVLEYFDHMKPITRSASVYGPEFELECEKVARYFGVEPEKQLLDEGTDAPTPRINESLILHLACHGYFDDDDNWGSGFVFNHPAGNSEIVQGRKVLRWRLKAKLTFLEACETGRHRTSITEDYLGLNRFFHMATVPSLLLNDWKVRFDVARKFTSTFYKYIYANWNEGNFSRGEAYRQAMESVYNLTGKQNVILWAPFTFEGFIN